MGGSREQAGCRDIAADPQDEFLSSFGVRKPPSDKEAFIKSMTSGPVDATAFQTLSEDTVIVDHETAVVIGTDTVRGTEKGATVTEVYHTR